MRKKIIAGNWKMNKTPTETSRLAEEIVKNSAGAGCDVVICPPAICIPAAGEAVKGSNVALGAQNVHFEESGAYTGEIAPNMLLDAGVRYVIIGHSERRGYFGETDETVNLRTRAALGAGLLPIVCVGESLTERERGITSETVCRQVKLAFLNIAKEDAKKITIAYEPIWAIGTGQTATADQADEVCGIIRTTLGTIYGEDTAEKIRIQYGGSMNPENAAELLSKPNIDGGLIGGASLNGEDFDAIVKAADRSEIKN